MHGALIPEVVESYVRGKALVCDLKNVVDFRTGSWKAGLGLVLRSLTRPKTLDRRPFMSGYVREVDSVRVETGNGPWSLR